MATIVSANCSLNIVADIHLIDFPATIGHGSIGGKVHGGPNKVFVNHIPIQGLDITLEDTTNAGIVDYAITDDQGKYLFNNISSGTYKIYVDVPGLVLDTTYTITITADDSIFTNFDFCVDSFSISACDLSTGVPNPVDVDGSLSIYPNPYLEQVNISFELMERTNVSLEIYNLLGEQIKVIERGVKSSGVYHYTFSAKENGHSPGIYLLRLRLNEEVLVRRLIELR